VSLAYLSLGSNMGDSRSILREAVLGLDGLRGSRLRAVSHLYRTEPVGYEEQADFLNLVAALETALAPLELLDETQRLEQEAGRTREVRWGPRTLDVDLVWYDGLALIGPRLELPHPRMEERRFVLEPLAELAPELVLSSGRTALQALSAVSAQKVRRLGRIWTGS
jgi:2-amino-4-hydroxy-6-hydroxymethyldihydropteridine diphosphokinase